MFTGLNKWLNKSGGVHPKYHKLTSSDLPIIQAPIPEKLYIPLRQHAGMDAIPIVSPGDKVLTGQLIAIAPTEVSAPVHASSSGVIEAIEDCVAAHPSGLSAPCIVIKTDGEDRWIENDGDIDPMKLDPELLSSKVAEAGIVGMGGAIFPAAVKLKQGTKHYIKTLLVNGAECEPYLTCDDRLMQERANDVIKGALIVRHILKAYRVVIAIEDNKPKAKEAIEAAAKNIGVIEIVTVPTRYPMGSAKQLIHWVTGREVPAGARSTSVGTLVHNVSTIYAIYDALAHSKPLVSRVATVAGGAVKNPQNIEARVGTPIKDLVELCGGLTEEPARLVLGGPMMGMQLPTLEVPLIKGSTGVLALTKAELPKEQAEPCIRCASCIKACPMGLMPVEMASRVKANNLDEADDYGLKDCILCGACAYVCPSHIPLVQYFQHAKGKQKAQQVASRKMDYTVELSLQKQSRIEKEKAEKAAAKEAKRKARQKASKAKSTATGSDNNGDTKDV